MKLYLQKWKNIKANNKSGGQGTISIVESIDGNKIKGALKEIHIDQQKRKINRERMCREITSLSKVAGNGVPKILDHNSAEVDNDDITLYFVSEWIEGKTLDDCFLNKPTSLEEAIRITRELCLIVDRCHIENVLHRDIKPKNILITKFGQIFLVDFGLAWIEPLNKDGRNFNSLSHEELSNWFLRLPELITGHEKHDKRSDITYLVGVFFFLLTGQYPKSLTDGHNNPPQTTLKELLSKELLNDKRWHFVNRIFSVGFQSSLDHRIQSAIDLIKMLDEITQFQGEEEPKLESMPQIQKLQELLSATSLKTKTVILDNFTKINGTLLTKFTELGGEYNLSTPNNFPNGQNFRGLNIYFANAVHSDEKVILNHQLELVDEVGTKMIASFRIDNSHPKIYYEGYSADLDGLTIASDRIVNVIFSLVSETYISKTSKPKIHKYKYYRAYRPDGTEKSGVNRIEFNSKGEEETREYVEAGLPLDESYCWATIAEIDKHGKMYPHILRSDLIGPTKK